MTHAVVPGIPLPDHLARIQVDLEDGVEPGRGHQDVSPVRRELDRVQIRHPVARELLAGSGGEIQQAKAVSGGVRQSVAIHRDFVRLGALEVDCKRGLVKGLAIQPGQGDEAGGIAPIGNIGHRGEPEALVALALDDLVDDRQLAKALERKEHRPVVCEGRLVFEACNVEVLGHHRPYSQVRTGQKLPRDAAIC